MAPFDASGRSRRVLQAADRLIKSSYEYARIGHDRRLMEFKSDGTIGQGSAGMERTWDLFEENGGLVLEIQSPSEVTCRLKLHPDGVWRGRWECFEKMLIEVSPHTRAGKATMPV
jgi:hypothetical protein